MPPRLHEDTLAHRLRAAAASVLAFAAGRTAGRTTGLRGRLGRWAQRAAYRPERHYMRGGGGGRAAHGGGQAASAARRG